jgi:hypothetical protein
LDSVDARAAPHKAPLNTGGMFPGGLLTDDGVAAMVRYDRPPALKPKYAFCHPYPDVRDYPWLALIPH